MIESFIFVIFFWFEFDFYLWYPIELPHLESAPHKESAATFVMRGVDSERVGRIVDGVTQLDTKNKNQHKIKKKITKIKLSIIIQFIDLI